MPPRRRVPSSAGSADHASSFGLICRGQDWKTRSRLIQPVSFGQWRIKASVCTSARRCASDQALSPSSSRSHNDAARILLAFAEGHQPREQVLEGFFHLDIGAVLGEHRLEHASFAWRTISPNPLNRVLGPQGVKTCTLYQVARSTPRTVQEVAYQGVRAGSQKKTTCRSSSARGRRMKGSP